MKKIIIISLVAVNIFAQDRITLEQSISAALQNSEEVKIATSRAIISDAKIKEIRSQLYPKMNLSAAYTRLSDVPPFEITTPFSPAPIRISDAILNNYNLRLSVQQPLFTGFRISSLKNSMEYLNEAAETDIISTKNELALEVAIAYWNLYKIINTENLIIENIKAFESHLEKTRNFLNTGLATKNDVLKLEVELSNAELSLIEIRNNKDLSLVNFERLTGIEAKDNIEFIFSEITATEIPQQMDRLINEAKQKRTELKAFALRIKAGEENIKASRSGYYPSLYAFGNYYLSNPNLRYQPQQDKFKGTWDIGFSASWDIWNWGYTNSQIVQAEQNLVQTQTNLELFNEALEAEITKAYLENKYAIEKIKTIRISIEQSEENLRITRNKFDENLSTTTDIIDAEILLLKARTNLANALSEAETARLKLNKATGKKLY